MDIRNLPPHVGGKCEAGGFWLYDKRSGVRLRRITMDDLPKKTHWAMIGRKGNQGNSNGNAA